jgi:hypothetical protein
MIDRNFFAELKRRNVVRPAGLYFVGAWLLTIGFIPALIFSWIFEVTPEGLKRDAEAPPKKSIAPQTARRMDRLLTVQQRVWA